MMAKAIHQDDLRSESTITSLTDGNGRLLAMGRSDRLSNTGNLYEAFLGGWLGDIATSKSRVSAEFHLATNPHHFVLHAFKDKWHLYTISPGFQRHKGTGEAILAARHIKILTLNSGLTTKQMVSHAETGNKAAILAQFEQDLTFQLRPVEAHARGGAFETFAGAMESLAVITRCRVTFRPASNHPLYKRSGQPPHFLYRDRGGWASLQSEPVSRFGHLIFTWFAPEETLLTPKTNGVMQFGSRGYIADPGETTGHELAKHAAILCRVAACIYKDTGSVEHPQDTVKTVMEAANAGR